MQIALDAMGGDHAPGPVVEGAVQAVAADSGLRVILVGDRAQVEPTLRGPCVLLDVGANVNPKPTHLYQYGVMGSIFARYILKRDKPTIGLMNIGSEEQKGHDLAKETHALFNGSSLREQFIGNVE